MSKECENCIHWSRHVAMDDKGEPVKREAKLAEPFWYYQVCKKNWGLPHNAYINASKCQFYKAKP